MEGNQFKVENVNTENISEEEIRKAVFGDKPNIVGEQAEVVNHPVEAIRALQDFTTSENNQKNEEFYKNIILLLDQLSG